jgi:hypothetical protein
MKYLVLFLLACTLLTSCIEEDPKPGEVWWYYREDDDPFKEPKIFYYYIHEVKDGWVKYNFGKTKKNYTHTERINGSWGFTRHNDLFMTSDEVTCVNEPIVLEPKPVKKKSKEEAPQEEDNYNYEGIKF